MMFKTSIHRRVVSALALVFVPASLIYHMAGIEPRPLQQLGNENVFEPLVLRADQGIPVKKTDNIKFYWHGVSTDGSSAGFASLKLQDNSDLKVLDSRSDAYEGFRLKYLGSLENWGSKLFALVSSSEIIFTTIDRSGHFVPLASLKPDFAINHVEVIGSQDNQLLLALVDAKSGTFHIYQLNQNANVQHLSSHTSSFVPTSDLLLPFGERSLVSIGTQELRLHAFRIEDGKWHLHERLIHTPEFATPDLAAGIAYEKSIALILHNQSKRSIQVLSFEDNNLNKPQLISLDNDEKWDVITHIPHSNNVILYKKKSALYSDRINVLSTVTPQLWSVSHSFSTGKALDSIVAIDDQSMSDDNFHPLAHKSNPIRVLHATLEYSQSEVGGIAAVTKTLIPKLNQSNDTAVIRADVIMPKFAFLKLESDKLEKVAVIDHYFKKAWTKSAIWKLRDGPFLIEPAELTWQNIYRVQDKNVMYNDEESSLPIDRWLHFSSAVAAFISQFKDAHSDQPFHVLHMHSYHTSVAAELLDHYVAARKKAGIPTPKTIFHMHSLSYDQGFVKGTLLSELGLKADLEWENLTKRSLSVVDFAVTVSKNMFESGLNENEAQSYGLSPLFRSLNNSGRLHHVLNGINAHEWDPTDKTVMVQGSEDFAFDADTIAEGKRKLKAHLKTQGLFKDDDRLLFTFVGRFSDEKGIEHLLPAVREVIRLGGNFAIMGSFSNSFNSREMILRLKDLQRGEFAGRLLIIDSVEEQKKNNLGRHIRAASDFSFVPSREETCGLVPLEFFGFGAMTVTSYVGGLKDTVVPFATGKDFFNGFVFDYNDFDQLYWTLKETFDFVKSQPQKFAEIRRTIMQRAASFDWSTQGGPVSKIIELYKRATEL